MMEGHSDALKHINSQP